MTIIDELVDVTGVKKKVGESRAKWLSRLHDAAGELEEDRFYSLSREAQKWSDADEIADPEGEDGDPLEKPEPEEETDAGMLLSKEERRASGGARKGRTTGASAAYRRELLRNPAQAASKEGQEALRQKIARGGHHLTEGMARIIAYELRATISAQIEAGWLPASRAIVARIGRRAVSRAVEPVEQPKLKPKTKKKAKPKTKKKAKTKNKPPKKAAATSKPVKRSAKKKTRKGTKKRGKK